MIVTKPQILPKDWKKIRLALLVDQRTERVDVWKPSMNYIGLENVESWTGRLRIREIVDDTENTTTAGLYFEGDILFGKLRPYLAKAHVAKQSGVCSTEFLVMKPKPFVDSGFLLHTILSSEFVAQVDSASYGAKMPRANWNNVGDIFLPVPSLGEQKAIADYLDRETGKIDALVTALERLLTLLAEKRQATITHAVTRGPNPAAPTRPTNIPWLAHIPAHWGVEYARRLFVEVDQRSQTGTEELLTVSHLTGVTPRSEKEVNMCMAERLEGYKICQAGDLVINTLWAWMGAMGIAFEDGIVSPAYNVYRSTGHYLPEYIDYLVRMKIFAQEATRYSKGVWSSRLRLYPEGFFEILLPVPPTTEQQQIIEHIKGETVKLDALQDKVAKAINLLKERRTSLISAAVTGQLRVTA